MAKATQFHQVTQAEAPTLLSGACGWVYCKSQLCCMLPNFNLYDMQNQFLHSSSSSCAVVVVVVS
jgi:hypothetical protein